MTCSLRLSCGGEFGPPLLNRDQRAAFAVRLAVENAIDCGLGNIKASGDGDLAETRPILDVEQKPR